jgi:hypothetical protein
MINLFKREKPQLRSTANNAAKTRVVANIPIIISGKDEAGEFREHCQTVAISRLGAKIETVHDLRIGTELTIEDQYLRRVSKCRVVWVSGRKEPGKPNQVGVCLTESQNFWGLEFPVETNSRDVQADDSKENWNSEEGLQSQGIPEAQPVAELQLDPNPEKHVPSAELRAPDLDSGSVPKAFQPVLEVPPEPVVASGDARWAPSGESGEDPPARPAPHARDAMDPALQATLMNFATKIEDTVEARSRHFEEKMVKAAEDVVNRTEVNLRSLAVNLEEKARNEFAEKMGAIEARSRLCKESLVKAADEVVARTEASLQGVASSLGEKARTEMAERVGNIEMRLQETVAQVEAVLPKLQDVNRYGLEIEKARESIKQLSSGAVEFALQELNELIEREIRPVASSLGVRAREYVAQEGTAALNSFLQREGADRLNRWLADAQQAQAPVIEARIQEAIDARQRAVVSKLRMQLESLVLESAEMARHKSEETVTRSLETVNKRLDEVQNSLQEKVDLAALRLNDLLAKVASSAEAVSARLQKQADEICNRLLERFHQEGDVLVETFRGRLLGATEPLEKKSVEGAKSAITDMAREVTVSSAAHFQALAEDKTREFVEVMAQTRERLVSETAAALRAKIGEMLVALQTSCEDQIVCASRPAATAAEDSIASPSEASEKSAFA